MTSPGRFATAIALGVALLAACATAPATHVGTYSVRNNFSLGGEGRWDLLAVDPAKHRVFLNRSDRVDVVDADSGKLVGSLPAPTACMASRSPRRCIAATAAMASQTKAAAGEKRPARLPGSFSLVVVGR